MSRNRDERIATVALLADPTRLRVFDYVNSRYPEPVGREETADALGISRYLAAFHLDRLVQGGLLKSSFRRLSGRTGPGAGRPAKLYTRADAGVAVSVPERRYDFAARLLARALVKKGSGTPVEDVARGEGRRIGRAAKEAGMASDQEGLIRVLDAEGFQPAAADGMVRLRNCPFHAIATENTDVICGMNLALMEGIAEGLSCPAHAHLDRQTGFCCVIFDENAPSASDANMHADATGGGRLRRWVRLVRRQSR